MNVEKKAVDMMKKRLKWISGIVAIIMIFLCSNCTMDIFAEENNQEVVHQIYFQIYDKDGNLKSEGYLPANKDESEQELRSRGTMSWESRTLVNGDVMNCYVVGNEDFVVNAGEHISMSFGLNRNAYIYSGIAEWNGITILAQSEGLTGGRSHSTRATKYGTYYGFIRNASTEAVTVLYANFTTPYL